MNNQHELIAKHIRAIADFPKEGILFRDITPLLASPEAFNAVIDILKERYENRKIDHILAIESRGFIFGAPLAIALNCPLQILRKPGKLPAEVDEISYDLEYGSATLQLHKNIIKPNERVIIIDDLLATGGTAKAATELALGQQAIIEELTFIIELDALKGREKLTPYSSFALLHY